MARSRRTAAWLRFLRGVTLVLVLPLVLGVVGNAPVATAQDSQPPEFTPPRLSMFEGDVSFWRPGAEDWAAAQLNTALAAGDMLYTGANSNLELQVGPRAFVRAAGETQIGLENQERNFLQLKVTAGRAALDLRRIARGEVFEFDTPGGAFSIDQPGYYRVSVNGDTTTFIVRRGGRATVRPADGPPTEVASGEQAVIEGTDNPRLAQEAAPDPDAWDRWSDDRTEYLLSAKSERYLPDDVYGAEDLDQYGAWRTVPTYGNVWMPSGVAPGWAPYSTGRWLWDPYYGWTWVDDAPWGWAPYHYGRWVFVNDYWAWAPGPIVAAPVYAPALVAFFGSPGFEVGIGFGTPAVSWVALGWGEPLLPWWGPRHFCGHPWWGGWGGPHVVNNVVVSHTTVINVDRITYRNAHLPHAVVAVHGDQFTRGSVQHARLERVDLHTLRPIRGALPIKPSPASLVPARGRGIRPPESIAARQVVATRAPRDPAPRLHEAGLQAPRVVGSARVAPTMLRSGPALQRPAAAEQQRTTERQAPPASRFESRRPGASASGSERYSRPQSVPPPHTEPGTPRQPHAPQPPVLSNEPRTAPQRNPNVQPPPPRHGPPNEAVPAARSAMPPRGRADSMPAPPRREARVPERPRSAAPPHFDAPRVADQPRPAAPRVAPPRPAPPPARFEAPRAPRPVPQSRPAPAPRAEPPHSRSSFGAPQFSAPRAVAPARAAMAPAPRIADQPRPAAPRVAPPRPAAPPARFEAPRAPQPVPQSRPAAAPRVEGSRGGSPPRNIGTGTSAPRPPAHGLPAVGRPFHR